DVETAVSSVRRALRVAVERQLVADVPVGAFLSGGLDSSAIVAFARQTAPSLRCFTIETSGDVDAGISDDLPYARRVAAHLGVQLDVVRVNAERMISDFERMIWHLDEPLADPAPLNVLYLPARPRGWDQGATLRCWGRRPLFRLSAPRRAPLRGLVVLAAALAASRAGEC